MTLVIFIICYAPINRIKNILYKHIYYTFYYKKFFSCTKFMFVTYIYYIIMYIYCD